MGYMIDADVHGKVYRVVDTNNTDNQTDQDIVDEVIGKGFKSENGHYYYIATDFILHEMNVQRVSFDSLDLSGYIGYHKEIDLPHEMFEETQWIKEDI